MKNIAKATLFYASCVLIVFPLLLIETPAREIIRAWKNMKICARYKDNFRWFIREWRKGHAG